MTKRAGKPQARPNPATKQASAEPPFAPDAIGAASQPGLPPLTPGLLPGWVVHTPRSEPAPKTVVPKAERSDRDDETLAGAMARIARLLDKQLCFVCGTMKSGTTWVQLLLDAHPEIACKGEGHLPNELFVKMKERIQKYRRLIKRKNSDIFGEIEGYPALTADDEANLYRFLAFTLFSKYDGASDVRVLAEKTPDNALHLDVLSELFPAARYIHVVRDGRDVAVSGWYHNLRTDPAWLDKNYPTIGAYAENIADLWKRSVSSAHAFGREHPEAMIEVRYEDLLKDARRDAARIFEFLGVDCGASTVAACCKAAAFETLTGGRRAGQEDRSSHFRKATAMQWREELSAKTLQDFESIAGAQLERLGYPPAGRD